MWATILPLALLALAAPSYIKRNPTVPEVDTKATEPRPLKSDTCEAPGSILLFTSDYSGYISTISLGTTVEANYTLTKTTSLQACGAAPSWLTYDDESSTLYCSDESVPGSLSAFSVEDDGALNLTAQVATSGGDVYSSLYGGPNGKSFIAIAGYNGNLTTFALPLKSDSVPLQIIPFKQEKPGVVPDRQASSHIHQVIAEPRGKFLLAPDLGSDVTRVFSVDGSTGKLTALASLQAPAGSGPRHATFKILDREETFMYLATEISNQVITYKLIYGGEGAISFDQLDATTVFPNNQTQPEMAAAEILVIDNDLYVSNRNMKTQTKDTISRLSIDETSGIPKFVEQTTTHGSYPRSFAISDDGTLAAFGNQKDGSVVVVGRDPETGKLSKEEFVSLDITADPAKAGLSSVVFAE